MATTAKGIVPDTKAKDQKPKRKPVEFDALDTDRYRAVEIVEWVELEVTVTRRNGDRSAAARPASHPVWGEADTMRGRN